MAETACPTECLLPKKSSIFPIKRLDSDINSIDSNPTHRFEKRLIQISRVGFNCDFRVFRHQTESFPYAYQDAFQLMRLRREGVPPPSRPYQRIEPATVHLHLLEEGIQKSRDSRDGC